MSDHPQPSFQDRVGAWAIETFGEEAVADQKERDIRFMEEAIEFFQARGNTLEEMWELAQRKFSETPGNLDQELGGVMTTLAAVCFSAGYDMQAAGEKELARILTKVESIRAKHETKPKTAQIANKATLPVLLPHNWTPTEEELASACLSKDHSFGLMSAEKREVMMSEAKWWFNAWISEIKFRLRPPVKNREVL